MTARVCAVVPAAGRGTRLGGRLPKILLPLTPETTVLDALVDRISPHSDRIHLVVAPETRARVTSRLAGYDAAKISVGVQQQPTGMGDAVFGCQDLWEHYEVLLVVWGDQVNLSPDTLRACSEAARAAGPRTFVVPLVAQSAPYVDYVVEDGVLQRIAQSREGETVRPQGLSDVGVFALSTAGLADAWARHRRHGETGGTTGEVNFLPLLTHLSRIEGWRCVRIDVDDPAEARGLNIPADLTFARHRLTTPLPPELPDIQILCTQFPPPVRGGLSRYIEHLVAHFGELDPRPTCHALGGENLARAEDPVAPVTVRRYDGWHPYSTEPGNDAAMTWRYLGYNARAAAHILRRQHASRRACVVAVHDWMACPAGILLALLRCHVVFHVHSTEASLFDPHAFGLTTGLLERIQARLARAVVVPTQVMAEHMAARGVPREKMVVIPHGADDSVLTSCAGAQGAAAAQRIRDWSGGPLVVFAGRFSRHKGIDVLLEAAAMLASERPTLRVALIGQANPRTGDEARVAAAIRRLGLEEVVWRPEGFLPTDEVYAWMQAADVCVFPSVYEPFGLVAIEAMALGTPVLLGPGYSPEVAGENGRASISIDRLDVATLAESLRHILDDDALRARLSRGGRRHARQFRWDRTVAETLAVYAVATRRHP